LAVGNAIQPGEPLMVIKRIEPLSFAKISATLYALMGLIFGAIVTLISMAGGFASSPSRGAGLGMLVGAGAIVVLPIMYGLFGFIATLIAAWLYNVAAGIVGGVEMDIQ
jgi:hypothetical protein